MGDLQLSTRSSAETASRDDIRRRRLDDALRAASAQPPGQEPPIDRVVPDDRPSTLAVGEAPSLREPQAEAPDSEVPFTPVEDTPGRLRLPEPAGRAEIAATLYGSPELAELVPADARELAPIAELLRPEVRAALEADIEQTLQRDLSLLADASLAGEAAFDQVLQQVLSRWSAAPGSLTDAPFQRLMLGVQALGVPEDLSATTRALFANANARCAQTPAFAAVLFGLVKDGASFVLDRLSDVTSTADSGEIADYLCELDPALQAATLLEIMRRYDEISLPSGTARFGEVIPENMLYFLIEDLSAEDRTRVADSLKQNQVLPDDMVDALVAGRGVGQFLPGSTAYAQRATEYWAGESHAGDGSIAATLMGGLSSLWLPETAATTALVLGVGGAVLGLVGEIPVLGPAITALNAVAGPVFVTHDLVAARTGRDPLSGRVLRPEERLSKWLSAGSGIILVGCSAISFRAGVVEPLPLTAGKLRSFEAGYVVVAREAGVEVLVPRSQAHLYGVEAPPTAPVSVRPLYVPAQPLLTEQAFAKDALQAARSAAGAKTTELMKPLTLSPEEATHVRELTRATATRAAEDAYYVARLSGAGVKQANARAVAVAKVAAAQSLTELAVATATTRANAVMATKMNPPPPQLDALARQALLDYEAGRVGMTARRLATLFDGATERAFLDQMQSEMVRGRATVRREPDMCLWEFTDGTVVRYKPRGDLRRRVPTYSVELKKSATMPDNGSDSIAFKITADGSPVAKGPNDVENPYTKGTPQHEAFTHAMMAAGHRRLKE